MTKVTKVFKVTKVLKFILEFLLQTLWLLNE